MFRHTVAFALLLLLIPALGAAQPPRPSKSEYLTTEGAGFMLDKANGAIYAMTFSVNKEIKSPVFVTINFENPSDRKSPFRSDLTIAPGQHDVMAESPGIKRIKSGKRYSVDVLLYADESRTLLIGRHSQKVAFDMPEEMATAFGIETP